MSEIVTEAAAARAWAIAYTTCSPAAIEGLLAEDVRYASQWVFAEIEGRAASLDYLAGKLAAIGKGDAVVAAESFRGGSVTNPRLKDIMWGGRVRVDWQAEVWDIAESCATSQESSVYGSSMSSRETIYYRLLDGGVEDSRGFCDSSCGMFIVGLRALVFVLYRLDLEPALVLGRKKVPTLAELEEELATTGLSLQ